MKKISAVTIGLAVLLALRLVGLSYITLLLSSSDNLSRPEISYIFIFLYAVSLIALFAKPKLGAMLAIGVGILDVITTIAYTTGDLSSGALVMDSVIIFLGYSKYKSLKS